MLKMITDQFFGVEIWGRGESIYFEIWEGRGPLAPLVPPPMCIQWNFRIASFF